MESSELGSALLGAVRGLIGQPLWSATAGPAGDFVLVLDLGARERRPSRLSNPRLSFVERVYEGSHRLVIDCPWRLDGPEGVVITYLARIQDKEPPPDTRLGEIEGLTVERVDVRPAGWDLELGLSQGFTLRCFAAEWNPPKGRKDWTYWHPGGVARVGPRGRVQLLTRAEAEQAHLQLVAPRDELDPLEPE